MKSKCIVVVIFVLQLVGSLAQESANTTTGSLAPTSSTTASTSSMTTPASSTNSSSTTVSTTPTTATPTIVPPTATPDTKLTTGKWNVSVNGTSTYCVILYMAALMEFNYTTNNNKATVIRYALPNNATVDNSSSCGINSTGSKIKLIFFGNWTLELTFKENSKTFSVDTLQLNYKIDNHFPNVTAGSTIGIAELTNQTFAETSNGQMFRCKSEETLTSFSTNQKSVQLQSLVISDMTLSAYQNVLVKDENAFNLEYHYCAADTAINSLVPIIVGAALAGLVLIVLIAYLIGRRRRAAGYESV